MDDHLQAESDENEDLWPDRAGQRIWADNPDPEGSVWVYCVLCGDTLEMVEGDEYMVYSNGMEVYVVHSSCGVKLNELRVSMAKQSDAQDHKYDRKEPTDDQ